MVEMVEWGLLTKRRRRKEWTSEVLEGPPMFRSTMAVPLPSLGCGVERGVDVAVARVRVVKNEGESALESLREPCLSDMIVAVAGGGGVS